MTSTYTPNKAIQKPAHNDYIDDWDIPVNGNSGILDSCLGTVDIINLTGLSSYTLTNTDLQSSSLRFTGVLNSGPIPILMPSGVSGEFTILNQTTQTDATSALEMAWASGGNTYIVPQNLTQKMAADATTVLWYPTARGVIVGSPPTMNFGGSLGVTFTMDGRYYNSPVLECIGTNTSGQVLFLIMPVNIVREITIIGNFSATEITYLYSGGSNPVVIPQGGLINTVADGTRIWGG